MTKARDLANVISGSGTLNANVIPNLPTSKITSGTFADARLSSSSVTQHVDLSNLSASNLTSGAVPSARLSLSASDIPNLDTAKITSGTLADARLSSSSVTQHVDLTALSASNLTSGTVPSARLSLGTSDIPALPTSKITSGTLGADRIPSLDAGKITSGLLGASRVPNLGQLNGSLDASKITSGTFDNSRISSGSVTQYVSATTSTSGSWTPGISSGAKRGAWGYYYRIGNLVHCVGGYEMDGGSGPSDQQGAAQNVNIWYLTGLPFTSNNNGRAAGGGVFWPNGRSQGNYSMQTVIKNNSTRIYLFSPGSDGGGVNGYSGQTVNYESSYNYGGGYNIYYTNRYAHMSWNEWSRFQGSDSRGWGWISVQYYI